MASDRSFGARVTFMDERAPADPWLSGRLGVDIEGNQPELLPPVPRSRDSQPERPGWRRPENEIRCAPDAEQSPEHRLSLSLAPKSKPPALSRGISHRFAERAVCLEAAAWPR